MNRSTGRDSARFVPRLLQAYRVLCYGTENPARKSFDPKSNYEGNFHQPNGVEINLPEFVSFSIGFSHSYLTKILTREFWDKKLS